MGLEDPFQLCPLFSVACRETQGQALLSPTIVLQADQLIGLEGQTTERMVTEPPSTGCFAVFISAKYVEMQVLRTPKNECQQTRAVSSEFTGCLLMALSCNEWLRF